jgi:pseudouridine-5'-phosphate glycosidase
MRVKPEVADALAAGRPVVALESTIVAHGLPRPDNLRIAREIEAEVREAGAVPATIAVVGGEPRIGLDEAALEAIATRDDVAKCGVRDLAVVCARGGVGAPAPGSRCSRPAGSAACTGRRARAGTSPPTSAGSPARRSSSSVPE